MSPSEQHERWMLSLLGHLERQLSGCIWCALGLRREHPPRCHVPLHGTASSSQMVTWQCQQLHAHAYDLLRDAHHVVGEKQQSAPSGIRCRPDITVLNADGKPLAFIEVVRTHLSEQAVAVAGELDIPLFVIPAPDENVVQPALGAAAPWWEHVSDFPTGTLRKPPRRSPRGARRRPRRSWSGSRCTRRSRMRTGTWCGHDSAGQSQISTAWPTRRSGPPSSPSLARGAALGRLQRSRPKKALASVSLTVVRLNGAFHRDEHRAL